MENCFFEEKIKVDSKSLSPDMEKSQPKDKSSTKVRFLFNLLLSSFYVLIFFSFFLIFLNFRTNQFLSHDSLWFLLHVNGNNFWTIFMMMENDEPSPPYIMSLHLNLSLDDILVLSRVLIKIYKVIPCHFLVASIYLCHLVMC